MPKRDWNDSSGKAAKLARLFCALWTTKRPDLLQQFALTGRNVSEDCDNYHRQGFGIPAQRVDVFICANLIEHAFANSQIVRAEAGAIETPVRHCESSRLAARAKEAGLRNKREASSGCSRLQAFVAPTNDRIRVSAPCDYANVRRGMAYKSVCGRHLTTVQSGIR
ncbi:hypothetical protein [Mesorhizobium sp.]|uniref:hypothetical protein n=1 Tax=Mesorhizobium sp. TaxID=1871066 RepID=UPI000FEA5764|nr:hypothetical protein [Mesorhizobium sp.]RWQ03591.1 MAG: hypothetical protein EOR89_09975 [Mesorhizobium sp.]